jgi:hypothetical protein
MGIEDTKLTIEVDSSREVNQYLQNEWVLILAYAYHNHDGQEPRFVLAWQKDKEPVYPELLDDWERLEMDRATK